MKYEVKISGIGSLKAIVLLYMMKPLMMTT